VKLIAAAASYCSRLQIEEEEEVREGEGEEGVLSSLARACRDNEDWCWGGRGRRRKVGRVGDVSVKPPV